MNAAYHPEISTALQHDLQLYESRMLYNQQSGIVFSAYSTQFQATPKQHLKGAGAVPHSWSLKQPMPLVLNSLNRNQPPAVQP